MTQKDSQKSAILKLSELYTKMRAWIVGAAFDSTELVAGQPRSALIAAAEIAAGKPPHI
jgi:hypothetical protein